MPRPVELKPVLQPKANLGGAAADEQTAFEEIETRAE